MVPVKDAPSKKALIDCFLLVLVLPSVARRFAEKIHAGILYFLDKYKRFCYNILKFRMDRGRKTGTASLMTQKKGGSYGCKNQNQAG